MHLKRLELNGFKSFAKKSEFVFDVPIIAIVGPNGSGKSNVVEAIRFVLGEQSTKSMRAKTGSDLIFKGSKQISKMSRASVSIVFDNRKRVFHLHHANNEKMNIDFDEVVITREVFSDGTNSYRINGNEVRMKDIHELIASVNIGSSGHHIISQGEADRYLNANVRDRRTLIEEALGLKVYQYRLKESVRKLEKAQDNMRESELLRRELAPHLRFLKKQVDKIERAKDLRIELQTHYQKYLMGEDVLIKKIEQELQHDHALISQKQSDIDDFLNRYKNNDEQEYAEESLIAKKRIEMQTVAESMLSLKQDLGRIEGMMSLLEKQQSKANTKTVEHIPFVRVRDFVRVLISGIEKLDFQSIDILKQQITALKQQLHDFVAVEHDDVDHNESSQEIAQLEHERADINQRIHQFEEERKIIHQQIIDLEQTLANKQQEFQHSQKTYYEKIAEKKELDGKYALIQSRQQSLKERIQSRSEEYQEARALLDDFTLDTDYSLSNDPTAQSQEHLRRELERVKIRLEDIGGGSGVEVIREYEETLERDQFLEKEMYDLQTTMSSLHEVIDGLKQTLNVEFDLGIEKINEQFGRFFRLMFGGGQARLVPMKVQKRKRKSDEEGEDIDEEDNESDEYGIDIKVQLPRKKVSDLEMLSGGERSLTSIALLFALSQVNPPPFLVLDETDAALDEANSQRYGDMVESLSKLSQLIVVTHNRETMSRAQTLFGVTLGGDDSSTTLSLRLEDATQYAK